MTNKIDKMKQEVIEEAMNVQDVKDEDTQEQPETTETTEVALVKPEFMSEKDWKKYVKKYNRDMKRAEAKANVEEFMKRHWAKFLVGGTIVGGAAVGIIKIINDKNEAEQEYEELGSDYDYYNPPQIPTSGGDDYDKYPVETETENVENEV